MAPLSPFRTGRRVKFCVTVIGRITYQDAWELGLLELAFGNTLGGGGINSPLLPDLMWGLGLELAFGMIFGVGIGH